MPQDPQNDPGLQPLRCTSFAFEPNESFFRSPFKCAVMPTLAIILGGSRGIHAPEKSARWIRLQARVRISATISSLVTGMPLPGINRRATLAVDAYLLQGATIPSIQVSDSWSVGFLKRKSIMDGLICAA